MGFRKTQPLTSVVQRSARPPVSNAFPVRLWPAPPATLTLAKNEVHVRRASLELPAPRIQELQRDLSEEELERADRFHFEQHRAQFIVARGCLGRY